MNAQIEALKVAQGELRHSESCEATIDRGTWRCSCGFMRAYDKLEADLVAAQKTAVRP